METVVVGGPHSYVGKTLAAEIAIRALAPRRIGAIKLTVADGERDPQHDHGASALAVADAAGICGRGASCGVCETVSTAVPSRIITSERAIRKSGTDTRRLSDAGAIGVVWIIALRDDAPRAVAAAIDQLAARGSELVVIEGTTALEWLAPAASVLVATEPGRRWKRVALEQVAACDIVLRNLVPNLSGSEAAPLQFWEAHPLACDLADPRDPGRLAYEAKLRALLVARTAPAG